MDSRNPRDVYRNQFRGDDPSVEIEMELIDSTDTSSATWKVGSDEKVIVDSHYKSRWRVRLIEKNLVSKEEFVDETSDVQTTIEQFYSFANVVWTNNRPRDILGDNTDKQD